MTDHPWDHTVPMSACPYCGKEMDGAANIANDEAPEPGDASVCFYCAGLCVYAEDLSLRFPDDEELVLMTASPALQRARAAVLASIAKRAGS